MSDDEIEYEPPTMTMAVTDPLKGDEPIAWQIQAPHPFVPNMKVMGMFMHSGFLEIYSTDEKKTVLRERFPLNRVRITREQIPPELSNEELDNSEAKHLGIDEEDDPDDLPPIATSSPTAPS